MSDFGVYKSLAVARSASNEQFSGNASGTGIANAVSQACTREMAIPGVANINANSAEGVTGAKRVPYASVLKQAWVTCNASSVANATDYAAVNVFKRTGNGSAVLMGTANLANVAVTAFVPIAFTLVSNVANTTLAAGDVITANNVKTGNGLANNGLINIEVMVEDV